VEELTCQQLVELVTDYFEGAMAPEERERFEAHLADCPGCEIYLGQMRTTLALTRASADLAEQPETTALLKAFRDYRRTS
jgi:anti-sigma factor RsiW